MADDTAFWAAVHTNPHLVEVMERAPDLGVSGCLVTGGAVFQTVWNHVTGNPPDHGIADYDLFYFDATDRGYDAEGRVVSRAASLFSDLAITVEVKNQARVHLWYQDRFGVPGRQFTSTEDAIDHFASTTCCFGIRRQAARDEVYAPHGFDDLFDMVLRPNRALAPRNVYETKAAKWQALWPDLAVVPWDPMR